MILSADLYNQILQALRSDRSERDKRCSPRVGLRGQVDVLLKPGTKTPPQRMRVRDLSTTGIGLLHVRDVPAGSEFIVRFPARGGASSAPVHVSCVVVHCRKLGSDAFAIGGRIIRVMATDEVALLAARAA